MEELLKNYRTPIISFCFGVLFSTMCIWGYITLSNQNLKNDKIEITRAETNYNDGENKKIYIAGAVKKEGIFEIKEDETILDFIQNNIGFDTNADVEEFKSLISRLSDVSLALVVPSLVNEDSNTNYEAQVASARVEEHESNLISINTASKSELESLPGIGAVYADRIIQGRPYSHLGDLKKIKGIGDGTYSKLEPLICL